MATFLMLVGVPGAGKSTIAERLATESAYEIISSDAIRAELYGDESIQDNPKDVFQLMHFRTIAALKKNKSIIYDATNIKRKDRMSILTSIKQANLDVYKHCVIVATQPLVCKTFNASRTRKVPEEVIDRMLKNFEVPVEQEGWNSISLICAAGGTYKYDSSKAREFEHNNPHHLETVGQHMEMASTAYLQDNGGKFDELWYALRFHDEGKLYTRVNYKFVKGQPVPSKECHFYGHQNYGAYLFLSSSSAEFFAPAENAVKIAALIEMHMQLYFWKDGIPRKAIQFWGEEFIDKIYLINKYDKLGRLTEEKKDE